MAKSNIEKFNPEIPPDLDHAPLIREEALDWLETASKRGFINYPLLSKYDPFLENIRVEPRFKKLMERVKHEWENFEI